MSSLLPSTLNIFCGIVNGFKDSLVGILAIRKIHKQNEKLNRRAQRQHNSRLSNNFTSQTNNNYTWNHGAGGGSSSNSSGNKSNNSSHSVYQRLAECCCFNMGVFGSSIVLFNWIILPYMYELMKFIFSHEGKVVKIWSYLNPILLYTFGAFWILPLFILSRFVNAFWFQDIAECTIRGTSSNNSAQSLRHHQQQQSTSRSVSFFIADTLFSLIIQALFLIQAVMVGKLLYIGQVASIFHLSLLYSLYSFEYKWFNNGERKNQTNQLISFETGWELHRRLHFIENNWPYFFGFGLPLAILTSIPQSYLLSGSIFSTLFPLFIISSNEAKPRIQTSDLTVQLFSPVVFLSNRIFQITIYLNSSRFKKSK